MRLRPLIIATTLLLGAGWALAEAGSVARPPADLERDAGRHPRELLDFAGLRPGMTVVDFWPGTGYWTRLFAEAVGPSGRVIAFVPSEIVQLPPDYLGTARRLAAEPGLANVTVESAPLARQPEEQNIVDVFWIFENYHDLHDSFMAGADVAMFDRAVYRLLKPGGVLLVADHAAAPDSGLRSTETLHRIDPAAVRAELEAAGFLFDGQLPILANGDDPHTAPVFNPAIRGRTDRFVYRFRKPTTPTRRCGRGCGLPCGRIHSFIDIPVL